MSKVVSDATHIVANVVGKKVAIINSQFVRDELGGDFKTLIRDVIQAEHPSCDVEFQNPGEIIEGFDSAFAFAGPYKVLEQEVAVITAHRNVFPIVSEDINSVENWKVKAAIRDVAKAKWRSLMSADRIMVYKHGRSSDTGDAINLAPAREEEATA
jgi:hypothetical protein